MSRSNIELLLGVALLAVLASKTPFVVLCGLVWLWSVARRSGTLPAEGAARAALAGGFLGPLSLFALAAAALVAFNGGDLKPLAQMVSADAMATSLGVFVFGATLLIQAVLLAFSVLTVGRSLSR
jgi:hypothetical protein